MRAKSILAGSTWLSSLILLTLLALITGCATNTAVDYNYLPLRVAAMSPDGRLAAVANSRVIWLLDTENLTTVRVMSDLQDCNSESDAFPHYGDGNALRFFGNEMIASNGLHGTITIWSVSENCPVAVLSIPEVGTYPEALAWSKVTGKVAMVVVQAK